MNPEGRRSPLAGARAGLTLLEVIVGMAVLLVAMLAMTATLLSAHALNKTDRERRLAESALRSYSEQIAATSDASLDDPGGWSQAVTAIFSAGGVPGDTFQVQGLTPLAGAPAVGSIQVITDETVTDQALGFDLGMPRDLDGDGLADNPDVSATATILPVLIEVRWTGVAGDRRAAQGFYILGY